MFCARDESVGIRGKSSRFSLPRYPALIGLLIAHNFVHPRRSATMKVSPVWEFDKPPTCAYDGTTLVPMHPYEYNIALVLDHL